jgi:OOP family OmpA-OmpF porin
MKTRLACVLALTTVMVALTNTSAFANGEEVAPPPPAMSPPMAPPPDKSGFYVGAMGGGNYVEDQDVEFDTGTFLDNIDMDASYDWGWAAGGTLGYRFNSGLRVELEGTYRKNDADELSVFGFDVPLKGDLTAISGMANVLYDIDFGSMVVPYVGVGAGAAYVEANDIDVFPPSPAAFDDQEWAFAVQGIAGVNLRIDDNIDLFADYRYFRTVGLDLADIYPGGAPGVSACPPCPPTKVDDEYVSHTVMAGLRYTFTEMPEMMPMAAPAPEPAPIPRQFMIFFGWDEDTLTDEAKAIVADAANYALTGGIAQIVVTGHTDTSGSASYNVGLSKRRADNTAAELVADGVDPNTIGVAWEGETNPLVPTGDGVREPQNRRVEIVFP